METPDWSDLPKELVTMIARRALSESVEDFMAIKGVCKPWRTAVTSESGKFLKLWPSIPFILFSHFNGEFGFYSLAKQRISIKFPVPEAKGTECFDVGFGRLLAVSEDTSVVLLNPFTFSKLDLPSFGDVGCCRTHPSFMIHRSPNINRAFVSDPDLATMSIVVAFNSIGDCLVFWVSGAKNWRRVASKGVMLCDLNYHPNTRKFYAIDVFGSIYALDVSESAPALNKIATINTPIDRPFLGSPWKIHLVVESTTGDLLLVHRKDGGSARPDMVFRLDLVRKDSTMEEDLGKHAIFVGSGINFCVDSSQFPTLIQPNVVYNLRDYKKLLAVDDDGGEEGEEGEVKALPKMSWFAPSRF